MSKHGPTGDHRAKQESILARLEKIPIAESSTDKEINRGAGAVRCICCHATADQDCMSFCWVPLFEVTTASLRKYLGLPPPVTR